MPPHADLVQRVVVASSDKAYGEAEQLPYTEESPLAARHPYEVSKAGADLIAQSYHHTYGLPVAVARCGNIFGGGDLNWSRIVPGTIRALLRDERPVLRSDGTFVRDYLYVRDVAARTSTWPTADRATGIAGRGVQLQRRVAASVLELVGRITRLMDRDGVEPVIENRAVGEIRDQVLSAGKAPSGLGWRPLRSSRTASRRRSTGTGSSLAERRAWRRERGSERFASAILELVRSSTTRSSGGGVRPGRDARPGLRAGLRRGRAAHLVDASLDFWLTTGRYAKQFEREFAKARSASATRCSATRARRRTCSRSPR